MPKNKGQRGEAREDWEGDETEESFVNGSGGNSSNNRIGSSGVGELREDRENGYISGNTSGGKPRQNKGGSSSQKRQRHDLGPWTDAVDETVQRMEDTNRAIKGLQDSFNLHLNDLRIMEETKRSLEQLTKECEEKDEEIVRQENAITILSGMKLKAEERLETERKILEQDQSQVNIRVTAAIAEAKRKLKNDEEKRNKEQDQIYDNRKKELENEFTRQKNENSKRANALEATNKQLQRKVEEQEKTVKDQAEKLRDITGQCEILNIAKDTFKKQKLDRESELEMMKKEFALSSRSKDYFEQRFTEIYRVIKEISIKYFSDIDGKDPVNVHRELDKVDSCFASIPIDDSNYSRNLRIAHAQRIISGAIYENIWKPFRSELTMSYPGFDDLLAKISHELENSSKGGRRANVWTALTMQALQTLPAGLISSSSEVKEPLHPSSSRRADGVVSKVFSVLSPLISTSQREDLRSELLDLAKPATEVWNDAQTGELKIIINPVLDLAHREDWRSQEFDPPASGASDEIKSDIISNTHPRIFTLFPRVVSQRVVVDEIKHEADLPGSWPSEPRQAPRPTTVETCIHPGVGLPEWSALVVRGKEEQQAINDFISNATKEAHSSKRFAGHARRESTGSSASILASPPSSPSQQWKKGGGAMKIPEK